MAPQEEWAGSEALHAVVSTGEKGRPLPGGRSRRTLNDVPILEVRDDLVAKLDAGQRRLLSPQQTVYLQGEYVHLHTAANRESGVPDVISFTIGGETLDEAAKSCIGAFEAAHSDRAPSWVASTHEVLAAVIGDHYGIPVRSMDEELAP